MTTDIQNLKSFDPFAEAEDSVGDVKTTSQNYIHIRIQRKCARMHRAVDGLLTRYRAQWS